MRNPNRLYNVYNYLMDIQMNYNPELRIGQFFEFIKKKIYDEYRQVIFYLEDEELLNKIKKFIEREYSITKITDVNSIEDEINQGISSVLTQDEYITYRDSIIG